MHRSRHLSAALLSGIVLASVAQAQMATITLDLGRFPSAEAASASAVEVDWADADRVEDARCTLGFAALELQSHLARIYAAGSEDAFPIRALGDTEGPRIVLSCTELPAPADLRAAGLEIGALAELPAQAFAIGRSGDVLVIHGGDRTGALYGAYGLLERLGVRWLGPEAHNTHVPELAWEGLPDIQMREEPAFSVRGFWAWEDRGNPEFFDWMARNRMNFWTAAEAERSELKKRGIRLTCGGHLHQSRFLNPRAAYPYDHPRFEGDEDRPADPYPVEQYRGDVNGDGVLSYSEAHPEWYGLRGGERSFNIHGDGGDNYCTSNPHATDELMKGIVAELADGEWRDADSINFWMLDGGRWCECENCRALGTPTDRNLLLVHRLREEIERALADGRLHRNIVIYFLAYADVVAPPTRPLPEGFDYQNCIATFFPIGRCYVHTLDDPTCTEFNSRYDGHFHGWATAPDRHYRGQICIGEYYNISGFKCLPINFARTMPHDVRYYYERGARHMHYMHCTTRKWGTKALTNWLLARLLWDPHEDADSLIDDYLACRYGPAAEQMRSVYADLDTALSNATVLKYRLARRISSNAEELFTSQHMRYETSRPEINDGPDFLECLAAIDSASSTVQEAIARSKGQELINARMLEDLHPIEYARALLHFYDAVINAMWLERAGDAEGAKRCFRHGAVWQSALQGMVDPVSFSSSHASAANAFEATYITAAWHRLKAAYGEVLIEPVTLGPQGDPVRVTGAQFGLGGALEYGNQLRAGGVLSEHANFIYAANNEPYDRMVLPVEVTGRPVADLRLLLTGTIQQREDEPVPIAVRWNDHTIFEGPAPFANVELSDHTLIVPREAIRAGENRLEIRCLVPEGPTGQRPWFGLHSVVLQFDD